MIVLMASVNLHQAVLTMLGLTGVAYYLRLDQSALGAGKLGKKALKHGLWIADVTRLDDDQAIPVPEDLRGTANALGKLIRTLQERGVPADQMPLEPPYRLDDCGWVANRWCELLPVPMELKQRLMELDNPLVRLELVGDVLERTGIAQ